MLPVKRLLIIFLLLLVPLQTSWSLAMSVHGHVGEDWPTLGLHSHAHEHEHSHDPSPPSQDQAQASAPHDDGHHHSHSHQTVDLLATHLSFGLSPSGSAPLPQTPRFTSHIPALPDLPPAARA